MENAIIVRLKWDIFGDFKHCDKGGLLSNSVTRQVNSNRRKIGGNATTEKLKWDILGDFQPVWIGKWTNFTKDFALIFEV